MFKRHEKLRIHTWVNCTLHLCNIKGIPQFIRVLKQQVNSQDVGSFGEHSSKLGQR